jgi:hypothetical protein
MAADPSQRPSREPIREPVRESSVSPHELSEVANAVEYTIQLTFVVAGGARRRTACGRGHPCRCAYRPQVHLEVRAEGFEAWADGGRCLCGRASTPPAFGCRPHRGQQLVVLDGDPPELTRLAARVPRSHATDPAQPPPGRDDPGLPPPGR